MVKNILVSIVRQLLSAALGGATAWLISRGAVTSGQLDLLLAVVAAFLVNLAWSAITHILVKWKINVALNLPSGTDSDALHQISKAVSLTQKIKEALQPAPPLPVSEDERVTGKLPPSL